MRHHLLDGLRGLAAIGVALYHFFLWENVVKIASLGTFAVNMFFVLSALTLAFVYRSKFSEHVTRSDLLIFFQNRFARIIPLIAAVAALRLGYEILIGGNITVETARAFLTATGLFALHLPGYLSSTIGAWSLGIEIMFYALFPVLMILVSGATFRQLAVAFCVLLAGQQVIMVLLATEIEPVQGGIVRWFMLVAPLAFAPFFAIGFLIERFSIERRAVYGLIGLLLFLAAMLYSLVDPSDIYADPGVFLLLTALSAGAVFFTYNGVCAPRLEPVMTFLGNISYALYLTHWISYYAVTFGLGHFGLSLPVKFLTYASVAMVVAVVTYYVYEAPARRLLRAGP